MSTTSNETVARLIHLTALINISLAPPILILGTIGNLINILVFSRKSLRKNPCSIYFCSASIVSLLVLYSGLLSRLLSGSYLDLTTSNSIFCKMRFYFYYVNVSLLSWFLVFASLDRCLSTSRLVYQRNLSRPRVAYWVVLYTSIISILFYLQVFYCFVVDSNQFPVECYSKGVVCRTFNDMQFLIVYSILPAIFMAVFGCLTIRNVRQIGRQTEPAITNISFRQKRIQLIPMLFVQIVLFFVVTVPLSVTKLYNSLIVLLDLQLTAEESARQTFIFNVTVLISYFNCSVSFYVYALAGSLFRQELKKTVRQMMTRNHRR